MSNNPDYTAEDFAAAEHHVLDSSAGEHISLGDEYEERRNQRRTVRKLARIDDRLRGRTTELTFYDQGFLRLVEKRRDKPVRRHSLDLRFLDPIPTMEHVYPRRLVHVIGACAGVALIAATLAYFGILSIATAPIAGVALTATIVNMIWFFFLTHEKIRFRTLHGRAIAIELIAGLGYIRRYRKLIATFVEAIESAEDIIGDDMTVYLREEMREHYRLRGDGVLTPAQCSTSTARILAHFE